MFNTAFISKYHLFFKLISWVFFLSIGPVLLLSVFVWGEDSIYYAVAVVFSVGLLLLNLIKYFVIRCPKCRRRPIFTGDKDEPLPEKCQYCGFIF